MKITRSIINYILTFALISIIAIIYFIANDMSSVKRFRKSSDDFSIDFKQQPSRKGLDNLRISGSSAPSQPVIKKALANIPFPIYIVDLRSEPHYFINGLPEYWYGYKRTKFTQIPQDIINVSPKYLLRRLVKTGKITHSAQDTKSEKEIIEELGYFYLHINQKRHHVDDREFVDSLVNLVNQIPPKSWIHFHCAAGRGRTTTAMVMFDILKNRDVPLEDIVARQHLLGGENLLDTTIWKKNSTYSKERLEKRKNFIILFYQYVHDPKGLGHISWTEWSKDKIINQRSCLTS
ncbi:hypothetical protein IM40_06835 [Candidatus Paracaedimonas acanthamoebae]|nr:hypothetical protein IM40_06835 [Candidatus Paracaedimonas acanthamoebae]